MFGFYRIAAAVPRLVLCDPEKNLRSITKLWEEACERRVAAVVFPELCLTGYTAGDLFEQERLYESQLDALRALAETSRDRRSVAIVGVALRHEERLFNCAAVIQAGRIVGIVPKTYLPNRREFYERRWFVSAREALGDTITLFGAEIPFGNDLLFDAGGEFPFGVEICEDLWAPTPVSNALAIGGARVVFNLSASNELVSKADYRLELVRTQSARLVCAYAYASSGIG
ncbi:nitrilase-related carbon-nitrogen hydrolase, partial [Nitratifractor sp.]